MSFPLPRAGEGKRVIGYARIPNRRAACPTIRCRPAARWSRARCAPKPAPGASDAHVALSGHATRRGQRRDPARRRWRSRSGARSTTCSAKSAARWRPCACSSIFTHRKRAGGRRRHPCRGVAPHQRRRASAPHPARSSRRERHARASRRATSGHRVLERVFALVAPGMRSVRVDPSGPWTLQRDDDCALRRDAFARSVERAARSARQSRRHAVRAAWLRHNAAARGVLGDAAHARAAAADPARDRRYERDDFAYRLPPLPFAEMDRIGGALNHLAATLSGAQETRRVVSLKLVSSQEEERARIARELHDEFGQTLTAMRADVAWLRHQTASMPELDEVVGGLAGIASVPRTGARPVASPASAGRRHGGRSVAALLAELVQSWRERPGAPCRLFADVRTR